MRYLILFHFFSLIANAQNENKNAARPERFVNISMDKMPIADFPDGSIPVSGIRIIQALKDSVRFGYAFKSLTGTVASLQFSKPVTEVLELQIKRMYKHGYKKSGTELLWVLRDLRLGEKDVSMQFTYARFIADAYILKEANRYVKACTLDTVFVFENSPSHGQNIEKVMQTLLRSNLLHAEGILEQQAETFTVERIIQESAPQKAIPILTDSVYKEGAYANFLEFRQNLPSISNFELDTSIKNEPRFFRQGQNTIREQIKIWGFCKDGEIYKFDDNLLVPIERKGSGFILLDYVETTSKKNNRRFYDAMIGGAIGGLAGALYYIGSNTPREKPLLVRSIPYITEIEKLPNVTCIDMNTGEFSF